ncbi:sigma-w pathway protein ysdB [Ornithinibacillus sp. L9]|uniref:Sigma-w pathway protein ysdB n=1 Tax=Ornithinibacillus caprae TaxID=2678566 RepID=A0A6N8FGP5_9BACI|nr:sigma-w pathway protein ysdB [Ornithinibacillus caprae]MUK86899.1 sigma-w pathway protein ysdB [Ornithinibacillus caprae]
MIVYLFRILIIIAIALVIYTVIQYFLNPQRKLYKAKESNEFYFLDEPSNSKKNLQFVYKGCLFEGEKYLGATEQSFEVVDIHVVVHNPLELRGLTRDDLYFLEKELLIHYPYATIKWKHPINQLMITD